MVTRCGRSSCASAGVRDSLGGAPIVKLPAGISTPSHRTPPPRSSVNVAGDEGGAFCANDPSANRKAQATAQARCFTRVILHTAFIANLLADHDDRERTRNH